MRIAFPVNPAVTHIALEPTTIPVRNVQTRRGKKRDRARLNALLQRLQAFTPGKPKRIERVEIVSVTTEMIMEKIVRTDHLIQMMHGERCTHLLIGPDFHHTLAGAPFMQFNVSVPIAVGVPEWKSQYSYVREIFGFKVVVVPWMRGFLPITDPGRWPKAVL